MISIFKKIKKLLLVILLRKKGAKIHKSIQFNAKSFCGNKKGLTIGENAWFEDGSKINIGGNFDNIGTITIGNYFYINSYSIIDCHYRIEIGNRVQIGPHCYITDFDHDLEVNINLPFHRMHSTFSSVIIEDNVWIGAGVIILKGVRIGTNSVIAAGALINKDVLENTIVGGNPQRVLKLLN